jgi:hypothetical protein
MEISKHYPPPWWGRIEVGVNRISSPSPLPSPTEGEGDNRVIFRAIHLNSWSKGAAMDPKLVRQFITFIVLLFGWTIVILLAGPK